MFLSLSQKEEKMTISTQPTIYYTDFCLPDSSFIETLVYDDVSATLFVQIDGTIYEYDGVNVDEWEGFKSATSAGSYYHDFVKGRKSSDRLDGSEYFYQARLEYPGEVEVTDVTESNGNVISLELHTSEPEEDDDALDFSALFPTEEEQEESRAMQNRQIALASAASVLQSRKSSPGNVIYMAKEFEDYLNGE